MNKGKDIDEKKQVSKDKLVIKELIHIGKKKGYLTFEDIKKRIPEVISNSQIKDNIYSMITKNEIDIVEEEPNTNDDSDAHKANEELDDEMLARDEANLNADDVDVEPTNEALKEIEKVQELNDTVETESDITGDDTDYIVILEKLTHKGKQKGYLTHGDIKKEILQQNTDILQNTEIFDKICLELEGMGIDVVEEKPITNDDSDAQKTEEEADKDDDLLYDPVRLYLREIGRIKLLTMEDEARLAKGIAESKKAVRAQYEAEMTSSFTEQKREDIFESLRAAEKRPLTADVLLEINEKIQEELASESVQKEILKNVHKALEFKRDKRDDNKLLEANLRLVVSIAKKYIGSGLNFLDLIQEGNLGLIKAVDKFDYKRGFKFSTYATWWIRQAITRAIADQARTIRIPVHMVETINKLIRASRALVQELGREPTSSEIAEKMGLSLEKVEEIQKIAQKPVSLDMPVGEEGEADSQLGDLVEDKNIPNAEEVMEENMSNEQVETVTKEQLEKFLNMFSEPYRSKITHIKGMSLADATKYICMQPKILRIITFYYYYYTEPEIQLGCKKKDIPQHEPTELLPANNEKSKIKSGNLTNLLYVKINNSTDLTDLDSLIDEYRQLEEKGSNPFVVKLEEYLNERANGQELNSPQEQRNFLKKLFTDNLGLTLKERDSTRNLIKNWIEGGKSGKKKSIPDVEHTYQICFALKMNEEEVEDFFVKGCFGRSFNLKNTREAVYYYCFCNKKSYQDALKIIEAVEAKRNNEHNSDTNNQGNVKLTDRTIVIGTHIKDKTPEELIEYLAKHSYTAKESHKTARIYIEKYFNEVWKMWESVPSKRDISSMNPEESQNFQDYIEKYFNEVQNMWESVPSKKDNSSITPEESQRFKEKLRELQEKFCNELFKKIFTFNIDPHEKNNTACCRLPKILRQNFPTANKFQEILLTSLSENNNVNMHEHFEEDKYRKMLIFLAFIYYVYSHSFNGDGICNRFQEFKADLNGVLATCGYAGIYPRNPFDMIILWLVRQKNPLLELRTWLAMESIPQDTNNTDIA